MRKAALGAFVLLPLGTFACTAILGDFDVAASAAGDGGGSDGTSPDANGDGGSTDANVDAADAQSFVFTTCGISEQSVRAIEEIDTEAGMAGYFGQLQIFRINQNLVRVIAQKTTGGQGATIYTFDPFKNGNNGPIGSVDKIDLQNAGQYLDARRLPQQGKVALLFAVRAFSAPVAHMTVVEVLDTNASAAEAPISVSSNFAAQTTGGGGNVSGALGAYTTPGEYFWALGGWPSVTTPGSSDLIVGHRTPATPTPTPVVVFTGDDRTVRVRDMARSQTVQYIFNDKGPDAPTDKGGSYFAVPQDATGTVAPKDLRPASGTKPWVAFGTAGLATGDGIRVAAAEVDFSSTNFGQVHAGIVSQADLASFDGSKIPQAFTITSLTEVPSEGEARFFGDDMLWLGTPPDPLRGQGLNFIWYATDKKIMRSKQTGAMRMLSNRTGIDKSSIWLQTEAITAVTADADVVFTQQVGTKTTLQYARLSCIR